MAAYRIAFISPYSVPIYSAPYRASPKTCAFKKKENNQMLREKVTEPAETKWASPVVLVPEKGGAPRFLRRVSEIKFRNRERLFYLAKIG